MKYFRRNFNYLFSVLIACFFPFAAQAAYRYTIVDYPGAQLTQLLGINNMGVVVGQAQLNDESFVNFLYDADNNIFTLVPDLDGDRYGLFDINDAGVKVGAAFRPRSPNQKGMIVDQSGTISTFSAPGWIYTEARGIESSGLVCGYAWDGRTPTSVGFIYDPTVKTFDYFVGSETGPPIAVASDINDSREVVGYLSLVESGAYPSSPAGAYSFLRSAGGAITYFRVNGKETYARGITNSGLITGYVLLPPKQKNDLEQRKGFVGRLSGVPGFESLNIPNGQLLVAPGATVTAPSGIDKWGRIIGAADNHGFIATPSP